MIFWALNYLIHRIFDLSVAYKLLILNLQNSIFHTEASFSCKWPTFCEVRNHFRFCEQSFLFALKCNNLKFSRSESTQIFCNWILRIFLRYVKTCKCAEKMFFGFSQIFRFRTKVISIMSITDYSPALEIEQGWGNLSKMTYDKELTELKQAIHFATNQMEVKRNNGKINLFFNLWQHNLQNLMYFWPKTMMKNLTTLNKTLNSTEQRELQR